MTKEKFKILYLNYYKDVFNHLFFCCNNHELSCDLTQETFLKLWKNREKIRKKESILPYLITISKNLLNDHFRHQKVEQKYIEHELKITEKTENPESALNAKLIEDKIREVITKHLSTKTRTIFIMSRFEGKSNDEIAKTLGLAKKTVENQIYKALSIIHKKINHLL